MYCPNCEFEIKQDVTECPICGGPLTQHPEETPDAPQPGNEPEAAETPDLTIDNLITDEAQEPAPLETGPGPAAHSDTIEDLDLESLLSSGDNEKKLPDIEPLPADLPLFDDTPDQHQEKERAGLPEPAGLSDAAVSGMFATAADENAEPVKKDEDFLEGLVPDENFLADTAAENPAPEDTSSFIDELGGAKLSRALNEMSVPPQQTAADRQLQSQDASGSGSMDFINEQQQRPENARKHILKLTAADEQGFSLDAFDDDTGGKKTGSFLRLIFLILLLAAVAVGGAYLLAPHLLEMPALQKLLGGPAATVEPVPPPRIKKPLKPSAPPAPKSEAPAPAESLPDTPRALKQPPQPTPSAPGDQPVTPAAEKSPAPQAARKAVQPATAAKRMEAPESAPAPTSKKPETVAPYSVHVFSFKTRQAARTEVRSLDGMGFDAYIETVDLAAKGIWHRVKVGHYATRAEAEQARRDIKKKYPDIEPLINVNR